MKDKLDILLVEDSPEDARFAKEVLKDIGITHTLTTVDDGVKALAYLQNAASPDVIILDLNMPSKNGHEVLLEMRKDPKLAQIPVILLTVSESNADVQTAMHLKMNYYLRKPVQPQILSAILQTVQEYWLCAGA
jgi:CheY-like chemotaxis protein